MQSGIIIEGVTRQEFCQMFTDMQQQIVELKTRVENNVRQEYTLAELAREKGYSKQQMKRILIKKAIPFSFEGKELIVRREHAGLLKAKNTAI